jgi:hypothetical protein
MLVCLGESADTLHECIAMIPDFLQFGNNNRKNSKMCSILHSTASYNHMWLNRHQRCLADESPDCDFNYYFEHSRQQFIAC